MGGVDEFSTCISVTLTIHTDVTQTIKQTKSRNAPSRTMILDAAQDHHEFALGWQIERCVLIRIGCGEAKFSIPTFVIIMFKGFLKTDINPLQEFVYFFIHLILSLSRKLLYQIFYYFRPKNKKAYNIQALPFNHCYAILRAIARFFNPSEWFGQSKHHQE